MLEVCERCIRPAIFSSAKRKSEEDAFVDRRNPAFLLVDRQFQPPIEVRGQTCFDALTCPNALHENDDVVGIPGEPVASLLKFPIQIV